MELQKPEELQDLGNVPAGLQKPEELQDLGIVSAPQAILGELQGLEMDPDNPTAITGRLEIPPAQQVDYFTKLFKNIFLKI